MLIARRLLRDTDPERQGLSLNQLIKKFSIEWHGVKLNQPDWSPDSHSIALNTYVSKQHHLLYLIFNAYWEPLDFELPPRDDCKKPWHRWIDTSLDSPRDIVELTASPAITNHTYRVGPRSIVVLWADAADGPIPGS
jgi:isoamylase